MLNIKTNPINIAGNTAIFEDPPDPSYNIITSVAEINMLRTWQTQIPDNT